MEGFGRAEEGYLRLIQLIGRARLDSRRQSGWFWRHSLGSKSLCVLLGFNNIFVLRF